ncbi:hypothetical protein ACSBR1_009842 [Camellia fascicularis]
MLNSTTLQLRDSSKDASIYFRVRIKNGYNWYVIKNDSTMPENELLDPIFPQSPMGQFVSSIAAVGSTIYVLGGANLDTYDYIPPAFSDVCYIDTLHPKDGWKIGPSMIVPRAGTHSITINTKIYAVLDTADHQGGWSKLRDHHFSDTMPGAIIGHAVLDGGKRILMHCFGSPCLYCYDVEADSWKLYSNNFGGNKISSAFVDGILYYVDFRDPGVIFGLDVSNPKNLPKIVIVNKDEEDDCEWIPQSRMSLVSLGSNKLAVLWALRACDSNNDYVHDQLLICCSKFNMSKVKNTAASGQVDQLVAHPFSLSRYRVMGYKFLDCLAVHPPEKMETQGASKDNDAIATNSNDKKKKKKMKKKKNWEKK